MTSFTVRLGVAGVSLLASLAALAQSTTTSDTVSLYGSIDQYLNVMRSSSGARLSSLNDGALLRSRVGFRGREDLGDGLSLKFNLEHGLSADSGAQADTTRFFDRQAWVGLGTAYGEFRAGRQNSAVFTRGNEVDFTTRALGSVANAYGLPARYDNDLSWQSPRLAGVLAEVHYAPGESTAGTSSQAVYQLAIDYAQGPLRAGYAGAVGKPAKGATYARDASYHSLYANLDHGQGKVYVAFVRSNNSTGSAATSANALGILGATGSLVAGTNADVNRHHHVVQVSADYRITPALRVGALWGRIIDVSNSERGAKGAAIGAYYDLSKRTTLLALADTLSNERNAGFRPAGSAAVSPNFTQADVNGQRIQGLHLGVVHRF